MDPQRKTVAGPMAPTSLKLALKSNAVANSCTRSSKKEIISVHTSTPVVETRTFDLEQNQVYQGEINVLSVMNLSVANSEVDVNPEISGNFAFRSVGFSTLGSAPRVENATTEITKDMNKNIMCCKYTEDENEIAAGFADGTIRVFNCNTGICTHSLVDDECRAYPGPVTSIKHRPVSNANPITNMLLSSYVNGCIKCWKYKYDQCLYTIREKRQTLGINYHPRNSKFVTYGDDAKLNMYDEEAQTQERAFYASGQKNKVDGHFSRIFACVFNPKSQHEMISGGWDNTVMCWDDRQPYATRYFDGVHMCGEGLDFDKPGRQILTCSWQEKDTIQLWDYGSCKLIETIVPDNFQSKLYCGKMVPHTNLIVCGGSESNILRVVDTNMKVTECSIRNNPGGIYAFDFGTVRRKPQKIMDTYRKVSELPDIPRVSFVSGKRLQTVDFG